MTSENYDQQWGDEKYSVSHNVSHAQWLQLLSGSKQQMKITESIRAHWQVMSVQHFLGKETMKLDLLVIHSVPHHSSNNMKTILMAVKRSPHTECHFPCGRVTYTSDSVRGGTFHIIFNSSTFIIKSWFPASSVSPSSSPCLLLPCIYSPTLLSLTY